MPRRTALLLTIGFLCVGIALLIRAFPPVTPEKVFITSGQVRGMAVSKDSTLYTLNFEQQEMMIDFLNQLEPVESASGETSPFEKIIIYRFDRPNIEVKTVAIVNMELVLSLPDLKKETSDGKMLNLLQEATQP